MSFTQHTVKSAILVTSLLLSACGGGGAGSGPGAATDTQPNPTPATADRFVISGNNNGSLSLLLVDEVAGFARPIAYTDISAFAVNDMVYDATHLRLVAITSNALHTLSMDASSGQLFTTDSSATSGSSGSPASSHLALSADGVTAYIASGSTSGVIDIFRISADGTLGAPVTTAVTVDPDYLALNPGGERLYLVSRNDDQIQFFDIDSDGGLAANPGSFNTDRNPTSLLFHPGASAAYLTRADSNPAATLQVLLVDASGALAQGTSSFDVGANAIDMVLDASGSNLYVLDNAASRVHHFSVDSVTGDLSFINAISLDFQSPTDLSLSATGQQLYIGHQDGAVVSTLAVNASDGSPSKVESARVFDGVTSIVAVGGSGALQPTATFLLSPDTNGLNRFSVDAAGNLALLDTLNTSGALISGEAAVDYARQLLFATGETASPQFNDVIASYDFNTVTGASTELQVHSANGSESNIDNNSAFQRIEMGRAGRVMYVLDEDIFDSSAVPRPTGFVRAYRYDAAGNFSTTASDVQAVGEGPENMTLHPAGRYLYSVNSFGDDIDRLNINKADGSISYGSTYFPASGIVSQTANRGRPIDLRFHPNGRFAYVSLEDDSQMVSYAVDQNGNLTSPLRENPPQDNGVDVHPGAIAVHPGGRFVYVGERGGSRDTISLYSVSPADYSLRYQSRTPLQASPSWIEMDPRGQFLIVRESGGSIEVFSINQTTGALTNTGQSAIGGTGSGGFLPSLTLVTPLSAR